MNWVAPIKDDETLQKFRDTLRSVDDKYYILFEIGIGTGLQLQDILQFKVKDVRGKDMLIAVIGTRQIEQAFPIKPELQAVITDFIDGRDDEESALTARLKRSSSIWKCASSFRSKQGRPVCESRRFSFCPFPQMLHARTIMMMVSRRVRRLGAPHTNEYRRVKWYWHTFPITHFND